LSKATHTDVSYGPFERNVLDLYLVESNVPAPLYVYIHGGGFLAGDKTHLRPSLLTECQEAGISVAAINYRLSGTDPYPAAMVDGVREEGMHHPKFGLLLKEEMDALGIECIVRLREELPDLPREEIVASFHREQAAFLKRHLVTIPKQGHL
jgi:hypothetical protein